MINATKNYNNEEKDNDGHVIRRERYSGSCSRNFYVGDKIKEEDIQASFDNGELKIENCGIAHSAMIKMAAKLPTAIPNY